MSENRTYTGNANLANGSESAIRPEPDTQELLLRLIARMDKETAEKEDKDAVFEIDLQALLFRLLDKWMFIVSAALVGAIVMAITSFVFLTPMYQATSKLYVLSAADSAINLSDLQIGAYLTKDYQEVFTNWEVHQQVIDNLGLDYTYDALEKMLTIENPSDTRILRITFRSDDPKEAMYAANEYANVAKRYIGVTMKTEEPMIMSEALLPTKPVSPRKALNTFLGFIIAGFAAAAVIVMQFILDDKVKTADEILRYADMPTLAVVPAKESDTMHGTGKKNGSRGEQG